MPTAKVVKRQSRTVVKKTARSGAEQSAQTALNSQVTDSISQADTEVVGTAAAVAVGNLFQGSSQALGLAALNATNAQQQNNMTAQASSTVGVTTLYSIDTATDAAGTTDILSQK